MSFLPDMSSVLETAWSIIKTILIGRHPSQRPQGTNQTTAAGNLQQGQRSAQKKKDSKNLPKVSTYKLKNELLNELIVKNDTSKTYLN
jgi:hypothetical protein